MASAGFKDLCATLLRCAEKFEQEMKINLNELNNFVFNGNMNDTKISLEKAKDYHYKEIMGSIEDIFKNIKLILFHDEKIRWLSDEDHFTKDELKRYSNTQNSQSCMDLSKAPDEEPIFLNLKREKRRVASEISIGTLEAWEKYLDHKKDETTSEEEPIFKEVINNVPKRTNPDFRRRKKFVSSTLGGFLEDELRLTQLNAIPEDLAVADEGEAFGSCEELNESLLSLNKLEERINNNFNDINDTNNSESKNEKMTEDKKEIEKEKINEKDSEIDKPRVVNVMYKKKPS